MQIRSGNDLRARVNSSGKFLDVVDVVNHARRDRKLTRPGDNFLPAPYRASLCLTAPLHSTPLRSVPCSGNDNVCYLKKFQPSRSRYRRRRLRRRGPGLSEYFPAWDKEERSTVLRAPISVSSQIRVMDSATKCEEKSWRNFPPVDPGANVMRAGTSSR